MEETVRFEIEILTVTTLIPHEANEEQLWDYLDLMI